MEKGYWLRGIRAKEGAYDTIDNVTKFALSDDDYEEYEEFIEYTEEELMRREKDNAQRTERDEFLSEAPNRMSTVETCISALTSAFGEVN
jgi:hypothetical protein